MSKRKHENPHRVGTAYHACIETMIKKQYFTKQQLLDAGHAIADIMVMISPRKTSKLGDKLGRGSVSAMGHLYYVEKLARKTVRGVKEAQRFRFRWREEALEPLKRVTAPKVEAKKVRASTKAKTQAKTKTTHKTVTA